MNPPGGRVPLTMTDETPLPRTPLAGAAGSGDAHEAEAPARDTLSPEQAEALREQVVEALRTCYDPEIPVNILELGLIYDINVADNGAVAIRMTLTSPACPAAGSLPPEVRHKALAIPGVTAAKVDVVWDPPWTPERMSEAAKLQLGFF